MLAEEREAARAAKQQEEDAARMKQDADLKKAAGKIQNMWRSKNEQEALKSADKVIESQQREELLEQEDLKQGLKFVWTDIGMQ